MIKVVASQYDPKTIEKNIQAFWEETDAYSRVRLLRRGGKKFFFVDGPPYTTGRIHLGTAWNKVIKDSILRYKSMKGYHILDRAGWDMHGLPIEVKVEEVLGFKSKKEIETYGIDNFVAKCKEFALQHKEEMTLQFQNLGVWLNWKDPYMTLRDEYIEAAWWTLKLAQEQGLLERGMRVVNWCPRCETAIADSEVEYWDEIDPSIYVKFKVLGMEDTYIVIWTTTPWTLPANIAVAVHPSFEYSKVKARKNGREEILIVASELAENVIKQSGYKEYGIIESMLGEDLKIEYEHPLQDKIPMQRTFSHSLYIAGFVTAENTGCVHIAPGHGLDDFELGIKNGLPIFCPVGPDGIYTKEAGEYEGLQVREANQIILKDLEEGGSLLAKGEISHRYGHCWRCKTPIIYLATEQWFLKVTELKDKMLEEIEKVEWYPGWAGSSRFKDWVVGARDWCISRQRYWGIPLPIWICEDCKSMEVIATLEELKEKSSLKELEDLHRPNVDKIHLKCSCGGRMRRVPDVFDVWFDSAVASWATLNYPGEKKAFEEWWPADFITEGHDQTRGWFYSQLGASMIAFGKAPYKSVLMHGFTLDALGRKMSKSLGNVVTPEDIVDKYGAEALRLYVLSQNAPWDDLRFSWEEVANIHRMLNILWNVYRFPLPYMVLDKFNPMETSLESLKESLRPEDRWILSRTQTMIQKVGIEMDQYNLHRAVRTISEFVIEDLSRWYIQLIRPRTWREANDPDKLAAYKTLYEVLVQVTKTLAPFAPYTSEMIYQNIIRNIDPNAPASVHMCDWEAGREELVDRDLEARMDIIRSITEASSNARQKVKRKLRWPVKRIVVAPKKEEVVEAVDALEEVLKDQTNSKKIILLGIGEEWKELGVEVVPNPSILGPVFKKNAARIMDALKKADGLALKQRIEEKGSAEILGVEITKDMVAFREKIPEHISTADFIGGVVYVDVELTREIGSEGYAREVIRRLQDMRKELDLSVEEEISAIVAIHDERVTEIVNSWKEFIAGEIRAKLLVIDTDIEVRGELVKDWEVEETKIRMGISR